MIGPCPKPENVTTKARGGDNVLDPDTKDQYYRFVIPMFIALCLASMIANLLVLLIAKTMRSSQLTPTIRLTLGLATADFWTSFIIGLGLVLNSYLPYVKHICIENCIAYSIEGLRLGAILTSVLHLLCISVNHYMAITRATNYAKWISPAKIWLLVMSMWIVPPAGFLLVFSAVPGRAFRTPKCKDKPTHLLLNYWSFRLTVFFLFLVPLILLAGVYRRITVSLHQMDAQFRQRTNLQSTYVKKRRRMITTALLIVGSFLLGWIPSVVWYLITTPGSKVSLNPILSMLVGVLTTIFMIAKSLINPIVYALRIPEFRESILRISSTWTQKKETAYSRVASVRGMISRSIIYHHHRPASEFTLDTDKDIDNIPLTNVVLTSNQKKDKLCTDVVAINGGIQNSSTEHQEHDNKITKRLIKVDSGEASGSSSTPNPDADVLETDCML